MRVTTQCRLRKLGLGAARPGSNQEGGEGWTARLKRPDFVLLRLVLSGYTRRALLHTHRGQPKPSLARPAGSSPCQSLARSEPPESEGSGACLLGAGWGGPARKGLPTELSCTRGDRIVVQSDKSSVGLGTAMTGHQEGNQVCAGVPSGALAADVPAGSARLLPQEEVAAACRVALERLGPPLRLLTSFSPGPRLFSFFRPRLPHLLGSPWESYLRAPRSWELTHQS
ncbi:uncharacterized protein LOC129031908 [Pongo pygmaeus]|uniref:uncharacterized protein LOC129031908 n=1 Tax=Pongo pygmaeus TaxID=9600 RepID=UPI0023E26F2D|nr:uncharacterized protein LOC129031908 [Pongo pygmaeus]